MAGKKVHSLFNNYTPDIMLDEVLKKFNNNEIKAITVTLIDNQNKTWCYWYDGNNFMTLLGAITALSFDMLNDANKE